MGIIYQNRVENYTIKRSYNNCSPNHMHRHVELFYVLEGSIQMTIDGKSQLLTKDMVSICFPTVSHKTETIEPSCAILLIFDLNMLTDFYQDFSNSIPKNPFITDPQTAKPLHAHFMSILKCAQNDSDLRMVKGYLYVLLSHLFDKITLVPCENKETDVCKKIIDYMNAHFTQKITLSTIASDLGYSKYYISHIFNEKLNCSFSTYLNSLRAEYAMGLLTHSNLSITEVGLASGFNSLRTFYRSFEQMYGSPPRSYRN
jgi:AraC-like DNA-binding protein